MKDRSLSVSRTQSLHVSTLYGVPQGFIVGPILFNLYVNDMSHYFKNCCLIQYADDTQFLHTGTLAELPSLLSAAEQTRIKPREYFLMNGLKLNAKKTQCIFLGTNQLIPRIPDNTSTTFRDTTIKPSSRVKNLGVYFDNYMNFDIHINENSTKITGTLLYINSQALFRQRDSRNNNTVTSLKYSQLLQHCMGNH